MTNLQRIALRMSEVRQRLNEIAGLEGDALTDEVRAEADKLGTEYRDLETRHRAAIVAEGEEESRAAAEFEDPESRELARLESRASIGAVYGAAIEHRSTDGETAELQQHLGLSPNQIPLALLREPETRAVTPAPSDVGQSQSAIIPGVFPRAAASWLSVDMPTVAVGDATFPVLTENAAPGTPAKGIAQSETTGAFSASVLTPARIQASFFYAREDRARFMGMDEALRMNLSEALSDKLDAEIIAGPDGLLGGTNLARVDASSATGYAGYKSLVFGNIDGRFAWGATDIRVLVGPDTLEDMARSYLAQTDSRSVDEALTRLAGGVRVSAHIPDPTTQSSNTMQDTIVRRGMRRDAVAPIWEGVTIIPDEVTKAGTGEIVVTAVMLHAVKILRADGFKRVQVRFT